ncbi:hypothetical protein Tco_0272224 [Tanacetum coccineum]
MTRSGTDLKMAKLLASAAICQKWGCYKSEGFNQIINFLTTSHIKNALTECPTLYASPIEQFWQTAALSTNEDGVRGITTTIDRNIKVYHLIELTNLCTSLSKKVESLESELKQTKQTYNAALTKLIKRVKKLEQTIKTSQARRRAKVVISDDEEAEGRFDDTQISDQPEEQLGVFSAATTLADAARRRRSVENVQTYIRRRREVSTGSGGVSTASRLVSTADISTASELDSTAGVKAKDKGNLI